MKSEENEYGYKIYHATKKLIETNEELARILPYMGDYFNKTCGADLHKLIIYLDKFDSEYAERYEKEIKDAIV